MKGFVKSNGSFLAYRSSVQNYRNDEPGRKSINATFLWICNCNLLNKRSRIKVLGWEAFHVLTHFMKNIMSSFREHEKRLAHPQNLLVSRVCRRAGRSVTNACGRKQISLVARREGVSDCVRVACLRVTERQRERICMHWSDLDTTRTYNFLNFALNR